MKIKYNERGEVISVNGLATGHHIGTPIQDAIGAPEENAPYYEERSTVTNCYNTCDDAQPVPVGANIQPLEITENGTYNAENGVNGYAPVVVNVVSEDGDEWYITDASYLFYGGARLESMDSLLSKLKDVTRMDNMFSLCSNLTELDVSRLDTSNVTRMNYMFYSCTNLTSVDVSKWDTRNVTDLSNLFNNAGKLVSFDMSTWDTRSVSNMQNMFLDCYALEEIVGFSTMSNKQITTKIGFPRGSTSKQYALKRLIFRTDLPGDAGVFRSAINVPYCSFERDGMVEMFNTLPDVSGLGLSSSYTTITITGNPCVTDGSLTAEDEAIATAKGWTLVK